MALKNYDPSELVLVFGGKLIEGTAATSRVKITLPDLYNFVASGDGKEYARGKTNNRSAMVEFSLLQTAASNTDLHAMLKEDDTTTGGLSRTCQIKNAASGKVILSSDASFIMGPPNDASYAAEVGTNVWKIQCADVELDLGGSLALNAE